MLNSFELKSPSLSLFIEKFYRFREECLFCQANPAERQIGEEQWNLLLRANE
jgi:hypothetical protein